MNIVLDPPVHQKRNRMGEEVGKIFVGGVNRDTTPDAFRAFFEQYGAIADIVLMMDRDTRKNKGYGFVKYTDPGCIDAILDKKGTQKLDGNVLDCKPCNARGTKPRGDDQRTKKIFVGGISQQADRQDLYEAFSQHGKVEDVHIMIDDATGKHRGFGFVTFASEDDVEKLVKMHYLDLKGKSMEIKKAMPKMNRGFGGPPGQGQMGGPMGGFGPGGGWNNQGGQPGFNDGMGGYNNQWNMGQPMGQFGQGGGQYGGQSGGQFGGQGGFQQRGPPQQNQQGGYGQNYNNGYRQQQQGGYGQQSYGQGQQSYGKPSATKVNCEKVHCPTELEECSRACKCTLYTCGFCVLIKHYGGKPSAAGDGGKSSRYGNQRTQGYGSYGNYGQGQQDPYGQQSQQQQYGNPGSMGNYPQEASTYGPQRVNYNQQGYSQAGGFGGDMSGQQYSQATQQQPQQQPQQQQQQSYGQADGSQDMYGGNNYGRGNMGNSQSQAFHPYRRFGGSQVQ
ncbi:uncharacterized protein [Diadema antillarum]|uniref:uncharacterized protein n=1 Tax=Diadema antillarum TaxID=105358 RepID=UPI003A8565A0